MAFPVNLDQCYLIETFGTTAGRTIPHTGDDWARKKVNGKVVAEAPDIRAVFAGTVVFAGWYGVAGNRVIIRYWFGLHGDYGHMRSIAVKVGQTVKESEKIGELGGTGKVTGPHLHYTQSTDLNRLLKGIYPYWKDPKTGRVLWASVDAWAKASGLQRPNYAIGTQDGKAALEQTEEDDMYTDNDRARDDLTHQAVARIEKSVYALTQAVNRIEADGAVNKWALVDTGNGLRRMVADLSNAVRSIPQAGPLGKVELADGEHQRIADAVIDEQRDRLAD